MLAHTLKPILPFVKWTLETLPYNAPTRQICTHVDALPTDGANLSAFGTKDSPRISESVPLDDLA